MGNDLLPYADVFAKIRADLKRRRITHKIAAEWVGTTKQTISNQLTGKRRFSKNMAQRFSNAFGYSVTWLLFGEGEMFDCGGNYDKIDVPDSNGRVVISVRVSEETAETCRRLSQRGISVGRFLDDLLPALEKHLAAPADEHEVL